jgi:hypothetical protein
MQAADGVIDTAAALVAGEATHVRDEIEELPRRHFTVAGRAFRQVTQRLLGLDRLGLHVVAADGRAARGGRQEAGEHLHGGGLARAVRPEEAQHLPGLDPEADAVHRGEAAIPFAQLLCFDHPRDSCETSTVELQRRREKVPAVA